jgi:hypothetical protein
VDRALTDEEEAELSVLLTMGLERVPLPPEVEDIDEVDPALLILGMADVVDALHAGEPLPEGLSREELAMALGALWGEELCRLAGWRWRYLQREDGLEGLIVAAPRKGFAVMPMSLLLGALASGEATTVRDLFFALREGELGEGEPGALRILG